MSKIHIGKNGPAPCKANKGKCPLGGVSGSDNHFDTMEEAEKAFEKQQGGAVKSISKNSKTQAPKDYAKMFSDPTVRDNIQELQKAYDKTNGIVGVQYVKLTDDGLKNVEKDFNETFDSPDFNEKYAYIVNEIKERDALQRKINSNSKKLSELSFMSALPKDIQNKLTKEYFNGKVITPDDALKIEDIAETNPDWKKEFAPIASSAENHLNDNAKLERLSKSIRDKAFTSEGRTYMSIYNNKFETLANGEKSPVALGGSLSPKELNDALKTINGKYDMPKLPQKTSDITPGEVYSLALDVNEQNANGRNLVKDIDNFNKSATYRDVSKEFNVATNAKGWSRIAGSATGEKELREIYPNPEAQKAAERIANNKGSAIKSTTADMDKYLVRRLIDEKGVDGAMKYLNDGFDKKESLHTSSIALNLDDVMDELNFKSIN